MPRKTPTARAAPAATIAPAPSASQVAHLAADIVLEKKGEDLVVLDITGCSDLADYMVIATGRNKRQVQAMAEEINQRVKKLGAKRLSVNGLENGWWVLLDLGDVLVHVMQQEARTYYDIEALWADGTVIRRGVEA